MMSSSKSAPEELMREAVSRTSSRKVRPWEIVHACEYARDIADVVEAQILVGMRPYLLTVGAEVPAKISVLQAWQDVRRWKKALDESGAHSTPQLIHAHCFAAGMACVRSGSCLVYDLRQSLEERLSRGGTNPLGSWASRSFRTAEQFVLAKASAVVVHSSTLRKECVRRGVARANIFVVPDPLRMDEAIHPISETERRHFRERTPQRIAEMYDEVYRYALAQRRKGDSSDDHSGTLIPVGVNL